MLYLNKRFAKFISIKHYDLPPPRPLPPRIEPFSWRTRQYETLMMSETTPMLPKRRVVRHEPREEDWEDTCCTII